MLRHQFGGEADAAITAAAAAAAAAAEAASAAAAAEDFDDENTMCTSVRSLSGSVTTMAWCPPANLYIIRILIAKILYLFSGPASLFQDLLLRGWMSSRQ